MIFYCLLFKSDLVPKWLPLWGVITVPFVLAGAAISACGIHVPSGFLALAIPYIPFEFFAGIYILVRGFQPQSGRD